MIFHGDNPTLGTRGSTLPTPTLGPRQLLPGSGESVRASEEPYRRAGSGGQGEGMAPFLIELVAVYTTGNTTEEPGYRWPLWASTPSPGRGSPAPPPPWGTPPPRLPRISWMLVSLPQAC